MQLKHVLCEHYRFREKDWENMKLITAFKHVQM